MRIRIVKEAEEEEGKPDPDFMYKWINKHSGRTKPKENELE